MPNFMTQKMSSGIKKAVTYYRKQSSPHVSHEESEAFTTAAVNHYATAQRVAPNTVETGKYFSGQGRPKDLNAEEI